jgi:crotonobetainyl-CoA:carnitine CoA-transferase CaiB-like acyl-CoA transferase
MRPLEGCRVLDLGIITAGAATSALLADLGAEVIKVEAAAYRDPFRAWTTPPAPGDDPDLPPFFRMTNRNKESVSLDLKRPEGREAFLRLVAGSDVVVENFSRGVLARLGIDYPVLRAARPGIILASISSQGETGPDARYPSFGSTLEAMAGLAWHTGYRDGPPVVTGNELNYPDQVVALFAAGMIVTAWRARTGGHLDLSQRELTSFLSGEAFLADDPAPRRGNAQAPYRIQECFRCAEGSWIAVSLRDEDRAAVEALLDAPADAASLGAWAAARPRAECEAALSTAGVAAAPVLDATEVMAGMGTAWRDAMQRMPDGRLVKGFPFQMDVPLAIRDDARRLGADSITVLERVGGLGRDEIDALVAAGVVGS